MMMMMILTYFYDIGATASTTYITHTPYCNTAHTHNAKNSEAFGCVCVCMHRCLPPISLPLFLYMCVEEFIIIVKGETVLSKSKRKVVVEEGTGGEIMCVCMCVCVTIAEALAVECVGDCVSKRERVREAVVG